MTDRKHLAKMLDWAAEHASYPASSKQCWFLAGLMAEAGDDDVSVLFGDICPTQRRLSSKMASTFIDQYLSAKRAAA